MPSRGEPGRPRNEPVLELRGRGATGENAIEDTAVEELRGRQVKNLTIVILLTSIGTPMLQMGDEMRRTQWGNSKAYCQDDEVSLARLEPPRPASEPHKFVRKLIAHRLRLLSAGHEEEHSTS